MSDGRVRRIAANLQIATNPKSIANRSESGKLDDLQACLGEVVRREVAKAGLKIVKLPRLRSIGDGLRVGGDLQIGGNPPNSTVTHEARRIPIRALPRGMRVSGSLEVRNCFRLERLPADMFVGGSILLEDCDSLTSIPDDLRVSGSLTIVGGQSLTSLPKGLFIAGDFRLSGTRITELPEDLVVAGSLIIDGRSQIVRIPSTIQIGGDIVLRHCPIAAFPEGLRICKSLVLVGCRGVRQLPAGLHVPENLNLSKCVALELLPADLTVGGNLILKGCTALQALPEGLTVPRSLDLRGCSSLKELPARLSIGRKLDSQVKPAQYRGDGPWGSTVARSREHFVPALRLADCEHLTELPEDLEIHGPIDVAGSGLRRLPQSLRNRPVLWRGVLVPSEVVFHPEKIRPIDVLREPNAELRRVMLDRAGVDRVLDGLNAVIRDSDTDPGGVRRLVFVPELNHAYLLCSCPSTARVYFLRVPPDTATCHHAAAWMAGFTDPDQYRPLVET